MSRIPVLTNGKSQIEQFGDLPLTENPQQSLAG